MRRADSPLRRLLHERDDRQQRDDVEPGLPARHQPLDREPRQRRGGQRRQLVDRLRREVERGERQPQQREPVRRRQHARGRRGDRQRTRSPVRPRSAADRLPPELGGVRGEHERQHGPGHAVSVRPHHGGQRQRVQPPSAALERQQTDGEQHQRDELRPQRGEPRQQHEQHGDEGSHPPRQTRPPPRPQQRRHGGRKRPKQRRSQQHQSEVAAGAMDRPRDDLEQPRVVDPRPFEERADRLAWDLARRTDDAPGGEVVPKIHVAREDRPAQQKDGQRREHGGDVRHPRKPPRCRREGAQPAEPRAFVASGHLVTKNARAAPRPRGYSAAAGASTFGLTGCAAWMARSSAMLSRWPVNLAVTRPRIG